MGLVTPVRFGRRSALPVAPYEIRDEVELYARENGRTATVHFVPFGGWFARFSLRSNDERMILYQQGRAAEPPTEDVWFHIQNPFFQQIIDIRATSYAKDYPLIRAMCYGMKRQGEWLPLDILQMGPSGVRTFLEKGNTWSGRGQHASVLDAVRDAARKSEESRRAFREEQKYLNRIERREERRQRMKIPFVQAGIDLAKKIIK